MLLVIWMATVPGQTTAQSLHSGQDFRNALQEIVAFSTSGDELRTVLAALQSRYRIGIFLDRRLDPNQVIEYSGGSMSLELLLFEIAECGGGGAFVMDDIVYVGLQRTAAELPIRLAEIEKDVAEIEDDAVRRIWRERDEMDWPRLSEPRMLATALADQHGLDRHSALALPHDLWAAGSLPRLPLWQRMALLAVGFDKTLVLEPGGKSFKLELFRIRGQFERYHAVPNATKYQQLLGEQFPTAEFKVLGSTLGLVAGFPQHYRIDKILVQQRSRELVEAAEGNPLSQKRVSLEKTEAQIGSILATVAKQLEVEFVLEAGTRDALTKSIRIEVQDVTYEELISKCLSGTELEFVLTARQLIIRKK